MIVGYSLLTNHKSLREGKV